MLEEIVEYRQPLFYRNIGNEIEIKSTYYEISYKASFCSFLNNLMPLFCLQMFLVERRWRMKKQKEKEPVIILPLRTFLLLYLHTTFYLVKEL